MLETAAVTNGRLDRRSEAVLAQAPILQGLSPTTVPK